MSKLCLLNTRTNGIFLHIGCWLGGRRCVDAPIPTKVVHGSTYKYQTPFYTPENFTAKKLNVVDIGVKDNVTARVKCRGFGDLPCSVYKYQNRIL